MRTNLIPNVLGCISLAIILTSCASVEPISVTSQASDRLPIVLPEIDEVQMQEVEWVLITEDNWETVLADLQATGQPVVYFALTDQGYENIAINFQNARQIIQQQQAIIAAYENYYNVTQ